MYIKHFANVNKFQRESGKNEEKKINLVMKGNCLYVKNSL